MSRGYTCACGVVQVAHTRQVPAYDYGYLWSPEVQDWGRAR